MEIELMKQNKNTPVVRVASAALAAFVLFFSLCVSSFGYSDNSVNGVDFTNQPYTSTDYYNSSHYLIWGRNSSNGEQRLYFTSSDDYYVFGYPNSASSYRLAVVALSSVASAGSSRASNNGYSGFGVTTHDIDNDLYYNGAIPFFYDVVSISSDIPVFSSVSDGLSAIRSWLDGAAGVPHPLSTSLPAGNAIIIDISGNSGEVLSLSSSSALRHKSPWSDGNQTMNYTDTAPVSISTPYGSTISWTGSGNPNLFGGYNIWVLNGPLNPTKSYLVIVNPAYPNDNPDSITSNQASNGPILISCAYCKGYTFVPLSSSWNNGSIVNESGSTRLVGEYDDSTQSWVTTNPSTGEPQNPVSGGLTDVDAEHVTINDWLQNISHQIGSFFSGAIGAVTNLVSAGSEFIQSLSSLYSWLPGPVYAVLSSALILVITIGVIKVFI